VDVAGNIESFLQILSAGLLLGCLYGLMCAGLGLIFGIMGVINFAQADFMMLAMYAALLIVTFFVPGGGGMAFPLAMMTALLMGGLFVLLGLGTHRLLIGRVSGTRAVDGDVGPHTAQLILTLGISLLLQNAGLMVFGSTPVSIATALSGASWDISLWGGDIDVFVNQARGYSAVLCLLCLGAVLLLLGRTALGRRLRAAASNPTAALYMGVDVDKAHRIAFGLGIGLTAVAGVCLATFYPFQPYIGFDFVIVMYAGVVLGGMGSVGGAFLGGLLIGLVQQLSTLVLPAQLENTAIFVMFLLVLLLRPNGLLGRSAERA
jgi:branched-chain amino acid transport system permease protein